MKRSHSKKVHTAFLGAAWSGLKQFLPLISLPQKSGVKVLTLYIWIGLQTMETQSPETTVTHKGGTMDIQKDTIDIQRQETMDTYQARAERGLFTN